MVSVVNGFVTNLDLQAGAYVSASHPVLALVDRNSFYVEGYFEETKLPRIHQGDPVSVALMGSGQPLTGHVESFAEGIFDRDRSTGANLLPNVNPTFNWVRLAQRIPVRVALDAVPEHIRLVAGQTATVAVHAARQTVKHTSCLYIDRWRRPAPPPSCFQCLAACTTVGPDYQVPPQAAINRSAAAAPLAGADEAPFSAQALPPQWWRLYRDGTLDGLIDKAFVANTDLRVAAANLARARAVLGEVEQAGKPALGLNAAPAYGRPSAAAKGLSQSLSDSGSYDAGAQRFLPG